MMNYDFEEFNQPEDPAETPGSGEDQEAQVVGLDLGEFLAQLVGRNQEPSEPPAATLPEPTRPLVKQVMEMVWHDLVHDNPQVEAEDPRLCACLQVVVDALEGLDDEQLDELTKVLEFHAALAEVVHAVEESEA